MPELRRDLLFGARLLVKNPSFTATAALLLAIGISANTLIFSVVNALLLRPLPVSHPENLVRLVEIHPNDFVTWDLPYNACGELAARDASLSEVICQGEADVAFSDRVSTARVRVHLVSPNFFSSLRVGPYLGRVLSIEDERRAAHSAVLSYSFWQRQFGGDPGVLGRNILLRGQPFTVVGVTPEYFNGLTVETSPDVRVPAALDRILVEAYRDMNPAARPLFGQIFGRLRNGVPFEQASNEVDSVLHPFYQDLLNQIFPPAKAAGPGKSPIHSRLRFESISKGVSTLRAQFSGGLEILMAAVALLLLMACANVAGLLLARSAARTQEIGIRMALGASPAQIVGQLMTEGLLLASAGGVGGVALAAGCLPLLARNLPPIRDRAAVLQPLAMRIDLDFRVLGFALAITAITAVLFALSPALRLARTDLAGVLRAARSSTGRLAPRNLIVVAQVAVCTLLLISAALLVRTLQQMLSTNPGFDRDHVVTFTIDPSLKGYKPDRGLLLAQSLLARTRGLASVEAASIASRGLMRGTGVKATFEVAGARVRQNDFLNTSLNTITPGYFESMGMHLLAGRDFTSLDRGDSKPRQVIVNQAFAARFFRGRDPVGGRFGFPGANGIANADNEIIGVASDAKYRSLREPIPPIAYNLFTDGFASEFILHVRTRQAPETIIAPVREILRTLDPELPFIEVRTLRSEVEASLWQERLLAAVSSIFGAMAALLAIIGLYGALDYAVQLRKREIGVRMALGASPVRIVRLMARNAIALISAGAAVGLCGYAFAAEWMRRVLFGVPVWEPAAVTIVVALVASIGAVAAALPAHRAARIDPATTLRAD